MPAADPDARPSPTLSVVIPAYNEAANIAWFERDLRAVLDGIGETYELVYVNDGSTDATDEILADLARNSPDIYYLCLSRNFGKEAALTAGLACARGQAVVIIDGDGQHPPELIADMVAAWHQGYQHVVGIRDEMEFAGRFKRLSSRAFYGLSRFLGAGTDIVRGATDYRLVDRELVDAVLRFRERRRMTRALFDWVGYRTLTLPFQARDRRHGEATYTTRALVRLAINSFVGSTLRPLYFVGVVGAFITVLSFIALVAAGINEALGDVLRLGITGTAYGVLFVLLMVGLVTVTQGIIAVYVANIHVETQERPLYLVNRRYSVLHDRDEAP